MLWPKLSVNFSVSVDYDGGLDSLARGGIVESRGGWYGYSIYDPVPYSVKIGVSGPSMNLLAYSDRCIGELLPPGNPYTFTVPSSLTLTPSRYWTYGGRYDESTGEPT